MLSDILPKPNNVQYMSITDATSGYHNLKLDEKSPYLTTFVCPFGWYQYKCLPFRAVPASIMFQCKLDKIFSDMPNMFGILDDILVISYNEDEVDHDAAVRKVLQQCEEVNFKLNKEKYHFRCMSIPFFGEVISRKGVQPDPQKVKALMDMPPPNNKKELKAFLSIINYLGIFSPGTVDVCDPLHKLPSSKTMRTWNASYQALFKKAKLLIKVDMCMKFYDNTKPLHLETDTSRIGLGAALLQTHEGTACQKDIAPDNTSLCLITFASKSVTGAEHRYSNIEREALGFIHGLEKFHRCFAREVLVITNHKPLAAIFKKDMATLSKCIQCILLKFINTGSRLYTKLGLKFSLQTGCPNTTTR